MYFERLRRLQSSLVNPILVKKKENLFYLTGRSFDYRAEEYLLVKKNDMIGFGSGLEHIDWIARSDSLKNIGKYLKGAKQLDVEFKFTYGEGAYLKYRLPGVKIKPDYSPVDKLRMIKEPGEIALVKKSMQIVEKVFGLVRKEIVKPGMTEIKLARFIQDNGLRMGAGDISFPAIVASGANAAIPHHVPENKKLKKGESIIIDFGFKYKNYCSDFTRTVFLGHAPKKLADAYNQVEKAYVGAMEYLDNRNSLFGGAVRAVGRKASGVLPTDRRMTQRTAPPESALRCSAGDVYQKSVDILSEKNLQKYFIHSLGHGTGLEIHELPNLGPKSKDLLRDGMVFSIEPGVYFPKLGGIRIEDLVYLEKGKVKKFISVPTDLTNNIF